MFGVPKLILSRKNNLKIFICKQEWTHCRVLTEATEQMHFLLRLRTLGATALISQGYIIRNLVVVELYPAAVRNTGFSFVGLIGKLRSMVAPQIFLIVSCWLHDSHILAVTIFRCKRLTRSLFQVVTVVEINENF